MTILALLSFVLGLLAGIGLGRRMRWARRRNPRPHRLADGWYWVGPGPAGDVAVTEEAMLEAEQRHRRTFSR